MKKKKKLLNRPAQTPLWKALCAGLDLLGLCWQVIGFVRVKTLQHIRVLAMAPLAAQGEGNGNVSAVVDIKAGPGGSVLTLSNLAKGYFLQRFDPSFVFERSRLFERKKNPLVSDLAAMAVDKDGAVLLAERSGKVLRLDKDLKEKGSFKLDLGELRAMTFGTDGNLLVLEPLARRVLAFSPEGLKLSEYAAKKLANPKALVVTQSGRFAVLDEVKGGYVIKVFSAVGGFERAVPVANCGASAPVTMAPAGGEKVAINDAPGARGFLFYDVSLGRFVGETMGAAGSDEPMVHPGFVGGDALTGDIYMHFGPGLLKTRLP